MRESDIRRCRRIADMAYDRQGIPIRYQPVENGDSYYGHSKSGAYLPDDHFL